MGASGGSAGGKGRGRGDGGPGGGWNGPPEPIDTHIVGADGQPVPAKVDRLTRADSERLAPWLSAGGGQYRDLWFMSQAEMDRRAGQGIFHLKVDAGGGIQGLATLHTREVFAGQPSVYLGHIESAPWNRPSNPRRPYQQVGEAIIEAAIRDSLRRGYGGAVSLVAERPELVRYYGRRGFTELDAANRIMVMEPSAAEAFLAMMEARRAHQR